MIRSANTGLGHRGAQIAADHPGDQAGDTVAFIDALLAIQSISATCPVTRCFEPK